MWPVFSLSAGVGGFCGRRLPSNTKAEATLSGIGCAELLAAIRTYQ